MKIVWDVDGVIRNLGIVHKRFNIPKTMDWHWIYKDKDIYGWVKEDYSVLINASPTKYLDVLKESNNGSVIEFWTYQPPDWKPYLKQWLNKYFKKYIIRYLKPDQKYKRLQKHKNVILVEDYPNYPSYDRIILIDRYYNKDTKATIRITSKKQLKNLLEIYNEN